MLQLPPLSLYIHVPWCVQKCPYCDFNSHAQKGELPHLEYVAALLEDLEQDLHWAQGRPLSSIFIGGGTPSLLSVEAMQALLDGVRARIALTADCEITMEANPGTVEADKFAGFQRAGINRISIGVQSFQQEKLTRLGRIHGPEEARKAAELAHAIKLPTFNLDLMHGLPDQSLDDALYDLQQAIDCAPPHLSWYQLTIEPNTAFASKPPKLPEDDTLWEIYEQGHAMLTAKGYQQYEISAYAKAGYQCRHNLNYWRFGDYLGIGCGAHGKVTDVVNGQILRTAKVKHPKGYLDPSRPYLDEQWQVSADDLPLEYFMNRFRLFEPAPKAEFEAYTGLPLERVETMLTIAQSKELIEDLGDSWQLTSLGHRYLNVLLELFMDK
ncbi:radical SAM family heme chaperone HemW [Aeromonas dhakensis]|uniref:radical SAM family heme chaperone HemW n=1 Tax=Aeromonas dhakensis TaxID=196024 RepID=UPI001BFC0A6A|nr:radical SAM family heme chaperone HemW [Aeromonas dhakensis]HDT5888254.1 radical SAM family heme chaperone HemW [Aeromonas dhakensis]HEB4979001.1 radical SAM family heme chaperone HemW [Aeromonas dhakensis]